MNLSRVPYSIFLIVNKGFLVFFIFIDFLRIAYSVLILLTPSHYTSHIYSVSLPTYICVLVLPINLNLWYSYGFGCWLFILVWLCRCNTLKENWLSTSRNNQLQISPWLEVWLYTHVYSPHWDLIFLVHNCTECR